MANQYFQFKQFTVWQQHCAMKITTDGCLFGAWVGAMLDAGGWRLDTGFEKLDVENTHAIIGGANGIRSSVICQRTPANEPQPSVNGSRPSTPEQRILDIGTGTGLLSLMLAQRCPWPIDAVEIDPAAAEQAAQNMAASPWGNRLQVIQGDITQVTLNQQYPIIISNPPFFENQLASPDAGKQKALHATALSLQALFMAITKWLAPKGILFLLLPAYRDAQLQALAAQHGLYVHTIVWAKQTPAHTPFRMMVQLGKHPITTTESMLIIKDANQQYSADFIALLKDYYLHL